MINWSKRDASVDSLRGVAIILMVAGHVIGSNSSSGMTVGDDSAWRTAYLLLADVRMPLFTAISGFVYAMRPIHITSILAKFFKGKARRLLVPLLSVGILFTAVQAATPGTNSDIEFREVWRVILYGDSYLWFLQAIFLIFAVTAFIDSHHLADSLRSSFVILCLATACSIIIAVVTIPGNIAIFSWPRAVFLFTFFWIGRVVNLFASVVTPHRGIVLLVAIVLFCSRSAEIFNVVEIGAFSSALLGVALGIAATATLLMFRESLKVPSLAKLGYFSYGIYLFHVFGTAGARILLTQLGITNEVVVFLCSLAAGLTVPVVAEVTVGRVPALSWAFFGQRPSTGPSSRMYLSKESRDDGPDRASVRA